MVLNKNRLYPHLLPDDIEVWEQFLAEHSDEYDYFDYDVRVGRGRDPGANFDPNIRTMGIGLSQRRIDAVGHKSDSIDIIEITGHAGIHAVGQLNVYPLLYAHMFKPLKPLRKLLVARELGPDVLPAFIVYNIHYRLYPKKPGSNETPIIPES